MKKLALALVCLVSVAFFASCDPEGQPSIAVLQEEGYVESGTTVNVNEEINFGFVCASSPMTLKDLSTLVVNVENFDVEGTSLNSMEYARKDLTGMTEYTYKDVITYNLSKDEIVGTSVITATVTDIDGQAATATITLNINQPELPLFVKPIEWIRKGANVLSAEEMATYGLQWTGTYKAPFATIKPIDRDIVIKAAKECGAIVTAEEHSVIGGLGSVVCDVLAETCPTPVKKVGVNDRFGFSGPAKDLLVEFGLKADNIVAAAKEIIKNK